MKITVIGGGSYCWTPTLFRDIVCTPGLEGSEIVLLDINKKHLDDLHQCCQAILAQLKKEKEFTVRASMDAAQALRGADYAILTITTGGYDSMENDLKIPYKYGIYQPVGDTVGPGGISRALRNIPVVVGLAKIMERVCPNAWLLNITNPMSTLTRSVWRETDIRCVGLCHELYGTLRMLEKLFGGTDWRRDFDCVSVGVNHMPWITHLAYKGKPAFPELRKMLEKGGAKSMRGKAAGTAFDETLVGKNEVKLALFQAYDALPAAGDRHIVEFFPYFCRKEMLRGKFMGVTCTRIEERRKKFTPKWQQNVADITSGKKQVSAEISGESTSKVISGLAGMAEWKDVLNLPNQGQIRELPADVLVETMGLITRDKIYGLPVGPVPPAILAQIQLHVMNQELTVEAAVTGDRSLVLQALLNDPLCGQIGDYRKMEKMMDELLLANRKWLPQFFGK